MVKKFTIEQARGYGYIMYPVDGKLQSRITAHMKEMLGKGYNADHKYAYFQELYDVAAFLGDYPSTTRLIAQLERGWSITFKMDAWEALHAWGYDACTLAE